MNTQIWSCQGSGHNNSHRHLFLILETVWQLICSCTTITAKTLNETHGYSIVVTELTCSYRPGFLLEGARDHKLVATATRAGIKTGVLQAVNYDRRPEAAISVCQVNIFCAMRPIMFLHRRVGLDDQIQLRAVMEAPPFQYINGSIMLTHKLGCEFRA